MKLQNAAGRPSRRSVSRVIRALLTVSLVLLAVSVMVLAAAGMEPAPLAALTGGLACVAGLVGIGFQAMGRWARDPEYAMRGKELVLLFVLAAAGIALVFWSTAL